MRVEIFDAAPRIEVEHGFSYWDSAIIAAARILECTTLYTEDLSHGRQVEGVIIINPFRRSDTAARRGARELSSFCHRDGADLCRTGAELFARHPSCCCLPRRAGSPDDGY